MKKKHILKSFENFTFYIWLIMPSKNEKKNTRKYMNNFIHKWKRWSRGFTVVLTSQPPSIETQIKQNNVGFSFSQSFNGESQTSPLLSLLLITSSSSPLPHRLLGPDALRLRRWSLRRRQQTVRLFEPCRRQLPSLRNDCRRTYRTVVRRSYRSRLPR